jgi:hypothetical protein
VRVPYILFKVRVAFWVLRIQYRMYVLTRTEETRTFGTLDIDATHIGLSRYLSRKGHDNGEFLMSSPI